MFICITWLYLRNKESDVTGHQLAWFETADETQAREHAKKGIQVDKKKEEVLAYNWSFLRIPGRRAVEITA